MERRRNGGREREYSDRKRRCSALRGFVALLTGFGPCTGTYATQAIKLRTEAYLLCAMFVRSCLRHPCADRRRCTPWREGTRNQGFRQAVGGLASPPHAQANARESEEGGTRSSGRVGKRQTETERSEPRLRLSSGEGDWRERRRGRGWEEGRKLRGDGHQSARRLRCCSSYARRSAALSADGRGAKEAEFALRGRFASACLLNAACLFTAAALQRSDANFQ